MIEMLLKAYLPDLSASLGIFIPLIVVNCIILARAEAFASKNTVGLSALDGLGMGAGFTLAPWSLCRQSARYLAPVQSGASALREASTL